MERYANKLGILEFQNIR